MTDPRMTPDPTRITTQTAGQICVPVSDLLQSPGGPRERQVILGQDLTVLGTQGNHSYVQMARDSYCGYVLSASIGAQDAVTHVVAAPATHIYARADLKSADLTSLTFASRVVVTKEVDAFAETGFGYIPLQHLKPVSHLFDDPAAIASMFLGTPYLWGGNSRWGIDCSGLVQAAYLACGMACPGDSDQQQRLTGKFLDNGARFRRNDLLFWKGHVALVLDEHTMIHANAHKMAVTVEPIRDAITRISEIDGAVTAHKRVMFSA